MIISNQKNALDIQIRETILTKVSTVKFRGITLDENLTLEDHTNKVTSNISKSVGVMRRLHCQLPANVMVKLQYSLVYSHLTDALLAWGRSGSANAAKIECAHRRACKLLKDYNQKILTFRSIYDYFALLKTFNTYTLNFHQYFKNKLYSHQPSHMHNTRHRTNSNFKTPLFNHSKTQKCYLCQVIPIWNSLPKLLTNCTSKFTFKKQIKSNLLASQSSQCSKLSPNLRNVQMINVNSSKLIIVVYMSHYLVLLISEFFPARLATLPYGLDSNVTQLPANLLTKPSVFYCLSILSYNHVSIKVLLLLLLNQRVGAQ